jgi:transcriptional regulator of acetoin/glycerol metabolism
LSQSNELYSSDFQLTPAQPALPNSTVSNESIPQASEVITDTGQQSSQELNLDKVERSTIETALKQHRYNISHTAKALGLTRAALYRRMEKHGL